MTRGVAAVLVAVLLLAASPTTAQTVSTGRTPRPTRPMRVQDELVVELRDPLAALGTVRPAGSGGVDGNEDAVSVIGGPETIRPDVNDTNPLERPIPTPTASATDLPHAPSTPSTPLYPGVSSTPSIATAAPSTSSVSTIAPTPTQAPKDTPSPTVSPTSTPSNTTPVPSARKSVAPTPSPEHATLPPQPQTPQAVEVTIARTEKTWPILVFIGGIAAAAGLIVLLLWRDTRFPKQPTLDDGTTSAQNKTASGELEYDWYASSPSLSSAHHSVDTFMGRQQHRMQSDPNVSSRAESTADLLNVSTVGDRSTGSNSNRTATSQPIQEEQEADIKSFHASVVKPFDPRDASGRTRHESDESSSPHISFDDEVNALSNWSGSDADASVQAIFDEHHRAFARSQNGSVNMYAAGGTAEFSPTSTDDGDDLALHSRESADSSDDEDARASERKPRRYSNGSTYSAVPSFSTAILGDCSFISSTRSDWSDLTLPASGRGSRQSLGSQDEAV